MDSNTYNQIDKNEVLVQDNQMDWKSPKYYWETTGRNLIYETWSKENRGRIM